jgi:hypothetical protein
MVYKNRQKQNAIRIGLSILCFSGVIFFSGSDVSSKSADVSLKKASAALTINVGNGKNTYGSSDIQVKNAKKITLQKVTYKSSDPQIAKVNKKGHVTAKKAGKTISIRISIHMNMIFTVVHITAQTFP